MHLKKNFKLLKKTFLANFMRNTMKTKYLLAATLIPYISLFSLAHAEETSDQDSYEEMDQLGVADTSDDYEFDFVTADADTDTSSMTTMTTTTPASPSMYDESYPGMNRKNDVFSGKPFPKASMGHIEVTGEFLYVSTTVNDIYYSSVANPSTSSTAISEYTPFSTHYDPAFRVAADYSFGAQGWSFGADWMWINTKQTQTDNYPFEDGYTPQLVYSNLSNSYNPLAAPTPTDGRIVGEQSLLLNEVDITLAKEFFVSKYFSLTPKAAATFLWYNHNFSSTYQDPSSATAYNTVAFKNKYHGFGFKFGGSSRFQLSQGLYILGDANFGMVSGPRHQTRNSVTGTASAAATSLSAPANGDNIQTSGSRFLPIVDARMDLGWRRSFCQGQYGFDIFVGYEYHTYFDAVMTTEAGMITDFNPDLISQQLVQTDHNMGVQGINCGVKFSF